ncbi:hypothetical protein BMG49_20650 [Salmonella enterica]|nr:hypothetical protein [Salmonella enterica]EBP2882698.1 hypothetical protein [Salmonella enterica]EBR0769455.1 hypothetical protein [Salmonella enterica]
MRTRRILGYGLPELAYWPQPNYEQGGWSMHSLKLRSDGSLHWFRRYVDRGMPGHAFNDDYDDYQTAREAAVELNKNLSVNLDALSIPDAHKESLRLKADKALMAKSRLMDEEHLMYQVAVRKHASDPRPTIDELVIDSKSERMRQPLHSVLSEMPYLHYVYLSTYRVLLNRIAQNTWKCTPVSRSEVAKKCYQERIARGFGFSGTDHWGKTKSAIRSMLLPRANQLLQLASVKRMLDEAIRNGQRVLIIGGYVFWYEDKNQVGWSVKEVNDKETTAKGNTIWSEGTIISKNHGRIVVLPYTKENGEHVKGYTKNAPNDGKAIPRHKDEYVELPFKILDGDLMFSLFGELNYE